MGMRAGLSACLLPVAALAGDPGGSLIGRTVPPYPDGLRDVGGACVSDRSSYEHVCDYSIGVLADDSAEPQAAPVIRYIVAGRLAGRDGQTARWLLTDALPYPAVDGDYQLQFSNCRLQGRDDARLMAIVRQDPKQEFLEDVVWARRLELPAGKFVAVGPDGVDCLNEAYLGL